MLGLGFSPAHCVGYFVGGVIDKQGLQILQEYLKSMETDNDKGEANGLCGS